MCTPAKSADRAFNSVSAPFLPFMRPGPPDSSPPPASLPAPPLETDGAVYYFHAASGKSTISRLLFRFEHPQPTPIREV